MEFTLEFKKYGCEFNFNLLYDFTREISPNALVALEVINCYEGYHYFDAEFCNWFLNLYLCLDIDCEIGGE